MFNDFINLFFPNYCWTCESVLVKNERYICTLCLFDLPQTYHHLCVEDNSVVHKLCGRIPIKYAMACYLFKKNNRIQRLMYLLKYSNKPHLGIFIGKIYGMILRDIKLSEKIDLIIPVPLHTSRLKHRGYNQSSYFAKGLAKYMGIEWSDSCLVRTKVTATQTGKNRLERLQNTDEAFCLRNKEIVRNKHILLVDDIITTGATIEACSNVLLREGVKYISVSTIAVTD